MEQQIGVPPSLSLFPSFSLKSIKKLQNQNVIKKLHSLHDTLDIWKGF